MLLWRPRKQTEDLENKEHEEGDNRTKPAPRRYKFLLVNNEEDNIGYHPILDELVGAETLQTLTI
jgi:hypothetical protein